MTDRYVTPHPRPDGALRELLVILGEEAAEIVVAASKAQRFGLADGYPGTDTTNARDLMQEVGDLLAVVDELRTFGLFPASEIETARRAKAQKLRRFMQEPRGERQP
jgi:NTP pyrophosphatase (non-canonical NTP hydrolase)